MSLLHSPSGALAALFALLLPLLSALPSRSAPRVLSGDIEYGEKYTDVYVEPEEASLSADDDTLDRYAYRNAWLQYEHPIRKEVRVALRVQDIDRTYVSRPSLDNTTRYGQLRLTIEPAEGWAVWPHVSWRDRDYARESLDNAILLAGVESRYRWGVRHNVRFGAAWSETRYDEETGRNRQTGSVFASYERPFGERLTVRCGARGEQTSFRQPSALRENAFKGAANVGFRYEF